jgi:hypothetical protein
MQELPVIIEVHKLYPKVVRLAAGLPSAQRQTLGRRLEDNVLSLLEYLVMAKNAPRALKASYLIKATATSEITMFHLRTFLSEKLGNATTIAQLQAELLEIQRQMGGWLKSTK